MSHPPLPQPLSGQPLSGQPLSGQPLSGQPLSAQPLSGQPPAAQPVTTTPELAPSVGALLRAFVDGRTWRATAHICLDPWVGVVAWCVPGILVVLGVALLPLALAGLPLIVLALWVARSMAGAERRRLAAFLDVGGLAPEASASVEGALRRMLRYIGSTAAWKELAYLLILLVTGVVGVVLVFGAWSLGLALTPWVAYGWALPEGDLVSLDAWQYTLIGVAALLAAPWIARGWAELDVRLARALLGPDRQVALVAQVERLEHRRGAAVDAADMERRRIERDLHDGAQQRLVSLAMNLGRAKAKLEQSGGGDTAAGRLVAEAHEDAKAALAELRDLARGIHPAVLTDRGLDAALSAVAARSAVPVTVEYAVGERPDRTTEAIAYFVVTEALTNVVKHSGARRAVVRVHRPPGTAVLWVEVVDDGVGGADLSSGSGLPGLANRVTAVDGRLTLTSPPGGPTRLTVELPCAS